MSDKTPSHHGIKEKSGEREYPGETIKLLLERASCRVFSERKIEPEVLEMILQAGVNAPTGGNLQPFSIIKVENDEAKKELVSWGNQKLIEQAPVSLLFCIDHHRNRRWSKLSMAPYTAHRGFHEFWISFQDTMIAAQNICTAADAFGLGSVYLGTMMYFIPRLKKLFALPEGVTPVVMVSMGYPATEKVQRKKLAQNVIVHNEKYTELSDDELLKAFDDKYPGLKVDITEERLAMFRAVCEQVSGKDFADKAAAYVKKKGYFNPAQRYFGLHYTANSCMQKNLAYMKILQDSGIDWFRNYEPAIEYLALSKEILDSYAGTYRLENDDETIEISAKKGALYLTDDQGMEQNIFAVKENKFVILEGDSGIEFVPGGLILRYESNSHKFEKIK